MKRLYSAPEGMTSIGFDGANYDIVDGQVILPMSADPLEMKAHGLVAGDVVAEECDEQEAAPAPSPAPAPAANAENGAAGPDQGGAATTAAPAPSDAPVAPPWASAPAPSVTE